LPVTATVSPPQLLFDGWFADLHLAFDTQARRLVAVTGKDEAFGSGVRVAELDETGASFVRPWTAIGGAGARGPSVSAAGGKTLVVAEDGNPGVAPPASPCTQSCDCLGAGNVDRQTGGLFAFGLADGAAPAGVRVHDDLGPDGLYHPRDRSAALVAGDVQVIASTEDIDSVAEVFLDRGSGWERVLSTPAPLPTWIGVLGTPDHQAWLGVHPDHDDATTQQLAAAVAADGRTEEGVLTDRLKSSVLVATPATASGGATTEYLLRGVNAPTTQPSWDHYEVLAVDASW
jgi:hypothetical protein